MGRQKRMFQGCPLSTLCAAPYPLLTSSSLWRQAVGRSPVLSDGFVGYAHGCKQGRITTQFNFADCEHLRTVNLLDDFAAVLELDGISVNCKRAEMDVWNSLI
jgi:hypothetical protein